MRPQGDPAPQELYDYLIKWHQVCDRIERHMRRQTDSSLVQVVQEQVLKCVAKVRSVADSIIEADLSTPSIMEENLRDCYWRVVSLNPFIPAMLDVLEFCRTQERNGHDGELNALFARLNFEDPTGPGAAERPASWADKARTTRIEHGFHDFARRLDEIGTALHKCRWVGESPPVEIQSAWSKFTEATAGVAMQFSPRYIHPYAAAADVPYKVDPSADPSTGAFGTVQKVAHRQLGPSFAQKTFQNIFSSADRNKILREIGVLELCHHRNIVEFVEAYQVNDQPDRIHLVMYPWAPFTLLQFLRSPENRRTRCPWARVNCAESRACIYRMMHGLADAVGHLHGMSIKHKDIKPDNILLHHEGTFEITPLLTDVGVSKVYKPGFDTDYLRSSYQYLAPEQLESRESSLRADIWQLGCCFAMMSAVASGGTPAMVCLWTSFENSDSNCSCNIAMEHASFMDAFSNVCAPDNATLDQKEVFSVVSRMLEVDSSKRIDIETVKLELQKVLRHHQSEDMTSPPMSV